jgi:phenylacetate-CoA ligase
MLLADLYEEIYGLSSLNQIFRRIILTGEGCSRSFKNKLEKIYGCRCVTFYGSLEAGTIGSECLEGQDQGYHITNSHIYLEIIDSEGNAVQDGERGEVVITTLLRKGSPLIRYRTGDLGYIQMKVCGCGLNERKLYICGRKDSHLFIGEKEYSPYYLEEVLFNIDGIGNDYRFILEDEKLVILLKQNAVKNISEDSKQKISKVFEDKTGIKNEIEIVDSFLYKGGKINRFIERSDLIDN